jgi:hypothetical protein
VPGKRIVRHDAAEKVRYGWPERYLPLSNPARAVCTAPRIVRRAPPEPGAAAVGLAFLQSARRQFGCRDSFSSGRTRGAASDCLLTSV